MQGKIDKIIAGVALFASLGNIIGMIVTAIAAPLSTAGITLWITICVALVLFTVYWFYQLGYSQAQGKVPANSDLSPREQETRIRLQSYSEDVVNTLRFLLMNGRTAQPRLWRFFDDGGFDSKRVFTATQATGFIAGNPIDGWEISEVFKSTLERILEMQDSASAGK